VIGDDDQSIYGVLTSYAGIDWGTPYRLAFASDTNEINSHEITEDVSTLYFNSPELPLIVSAPAEEIVYTFGGNVYNRVTVAAAEYGKGKMVAIADTECLNGQFISEADNLILGKNIIRWLNNEIPISIIDSPKNNSKFLVTDTIQFDGSSSYDPDNNALTYLWSSNISGEIGTTASFTTTLEAGHHAITLEVSDSAGKIGVAEITLRVFSPPTVAIQFPSKDSLLNGVVEVSGTAFDTDGVIQKVESQLDDDTWQNTTDTSVSEDWSTWVLFWDTTVGSDGDHKISIKTVDNDGLNSSIDSIIVMVDNTPPRIITGPEVSSIGETEATIEWKTDEPCDGVVEYGSDSKYGYSESNESYDTQHSFVLKDLSPSTTYHFRVISSDEVGNGPVSSNDNTFETASPPDLTPPIVQITSPIDTEILNGNVLITADISDDIGIAKVEFYIDDKLKFTDIIPDYSWLWDTANGQYPDDQYSIKIIAIDLSDNEARDEITVTLDNEIIAPSIVLARANPSSVPSGEFTEVLFIIKIDDPENRLDEVAIDLSAIDGSSDQRMYDDGSHGDIETGDYIYSYTATISSNVLPGVKSLSISITYAQGMTIETTVRLSVTPQNPVEASDGMSSAEQEQMFLWLLSIVSVVIVIVVLVAFALVIRRRRPGNAVEVYPLD
jgi:hypothetical protein